MNQHALTRIVAACDGLYEDTRNTGNHNDSWLLGVAAAIQRLELYGGYIAADCT